MSLVAYADSDEDSSDNESVEAALLSVAGQQRSTAVKSEDIGGPVYFPATDMLGQ